MRIDVNFDTLKRVDVFVSGLDRRLSDFSRLWTDFIAPFTFDEADEVFETEGYGRWGPLDAIYAARKARAHPGKGILQREGTFREAATNPEHPGSLSEASPSEWVVGFRSDYFTSRFGAHYPAIHAEGNEERNLSARPVHAYIVAGAQFEERVGQLGEKWQREEIAILERSV